MNNSVTKDWYDESYRSGQFKSQRLYPNEELLRFLGRTYFSVTIREQRHAIKILELGCGSCANLWMIAKEGFDAYGIDLSPEAITLGHQMLAHWHTTADLQVADMTKLPYPDQSFDTVVDIFSSYCLPLDLFNHCLTEVHRCLKPRGVFFSYTPSVRSDAFTDYAPAIKIDDCTLSGICRTSAAYSGNHYPFRFMNISQYRQILQSHRLTPYYAETTARTYFNQAERFEFISIASQKTA